MKKMIHDKERHVWINHIKKIFHSFVIIKSILSSSIIDLIYKLGQCQCFLGECKIPRSIEIQELYREIHCNIQTLFI